MAKVILITGANAMDSKSLCRYLQNRDIELVLTYRRNTLFNIENWFAEVQIDPENKHKISFENCDITDQNSVRECLSLVQRKHGKIDQIYLIAAMSHVGNSFTQREYSIIANGQSYYYFLDWLKYNSKSTSLYGAATSELFGNVPNGEFYNEKSPWNPKSPYALGKQLGAGWIKLYRESTDSNLFACFGILFNHSNYFRSEDFYIARVCSYAAKIAHGQEKELTLGNLNFWRDEHFSCFGVEAMTKMLEQDQPEDFVVGTGKTYHGEQYLDEAFGYFNLDWKNYVKIDDDRKRPNEVVRLIADPSRAVEKLGWKPDRMTFKQHMGELCSFWDHKVQGKYFKLPNIWEKYP